MTEADEQHIGQRAKGLRILAAALLVGTLFMTAAMIAMFYVAFEGKPPIDAGPNGVPVLSLLFTAVAVLALLSSRFVTRQMRDRAASQSVASPTPRRTPRGPAVTNLVGAYAGSLMIGLAVAEASASLGATAFLLEGHWLAMIPVGLGVLALIWMFPTEADMRDWVESRLR